MSVAGDDQLARALPASSDDIAGAARTPGGPLEAWLTGTGTPAVLVDRAGPSNLLRAGEQVMVVDCGNSTAYQLARLGVRVSDVTHLFVTHHHVDHNIDLGFLLMSRWVQNRGRDRPPLIIGPPGTLNYVNRVLASQNYDLRVRLPHGYSPATLDPRIVEVEDGDVVEGGEWHATAFRVDHLPVDQAFGFRFDSAHASIVISGDTRPNDNLIRYARGCDVLVHEVIYPGFGIPEYHTLACDVGRVATAARAKRLALTHLLPGDRRDEDWLEQIGDSYEGAVMVGHDLLKVL